VIAANSINSENFVLPIARYIFDRMLEREKNERKIPK
jgi:hypothetical protein